MIEPETFRLARATFEMARRDADEEPENDVEFALLDDALMDAESRLLLAPAPDLQALAFKLQVFADEECYLRPHLQVREFLAAIVSDARRLAGDAQ